MRVLPPMEAKGS